MAPLPLNTSDATAFKGGQVLSRQNGTLGDKTHLYRQVPSWFAHTKRLRFLQHRILTIADLTVTPNR